jgi:hypothetical protein
MSVRNAITLACLAVALAALSPASAPAAARSDRPLKGSVSGMDSIDVSMLPIDQTLAIEADAAGAISHLGKATAHLEAHGALTAQGTVAASGTSTIVAANGDQLSGTFTLAGPAPSLGVHQITIVMTITGGTGRFADATGTLRSAQQVTPISIDGGILHQASEGPLSGGLNY